jgi:hypothetical protein
MLLANLLTKSLKNLELKECLSWDLVMMMPSKSCFLKKHVVTFEGLNLYLYILCQIT